MEIHILAIGKMKDADELNLFDDYIKKSRWEITVKEFECKNDLPDMERRQKESQMLLDAVPKGAIIVALDEHGKELSSEDFAAKLKQWEEIRGKVAFLIGGANGHHDILRQRSDYMLSLSKMTWPHFMARVMLSEQIYRARMIMENHPYHKA